MLCLFLHFIFFSCQKLDNPSVSYTPVACAGIDRLITLPFNSVTLDGNCSTDPDNDIVAYQWTKIAGPASHNIIATNAAQTQINNLEEGVYQIELKVTDAGGLFSKDTVRVTVQKIMNPCRTGPFAKLNAQLVPIGPLSEKRSAMSIASAGNKILFAGGDKEFLTFPPQDVTNRVDIYDIATNSWSTASLSVGRFNMATIAVGTKLFFGGGEQGNGQPVVSNIDIYDAATNSWSVAHLSIPGTDIAAAVIGNKVFFAGGFNQNNPARATRVDIYDLSTNTLSTASLSAPKIRGHSAVTAGNKLYIAGGKDGNGNPVKTIDVYDQVTNSWSTSNLLMERAYFGTVVVNNKIYWAGGFTDNTYNSRCDMEVMDVTTGQSTIQSLGLPGYREINYGYNPVVKNGNILFLEQNHFNLLDVGTNTLYEGTWPLINGFSVISVNNVVYIAGSTDTQLWKLEIL